MAAPIAKGYLKGKGFETTMEEDNRLDESQIRCRAIIEILGSPKEHVEETLKKYTEGIKKDPELSVLNLQIHPVEPVEKDMFSTFAEIEMVLKGMPKLLGFCFDYMPSSIEIIKPERMVVLDRHLSGFLNDLQARLHNVDSIIKRLRLENSFLKRNLSNTIKNNLLILMALGKRTIDELASFSGIAKQELQAHLERMIKEDEVTEQDGIYIPKGRKHERAAEQS